MRMHMHIHHDETNETGVSLYIGFLIATTEFALSNEAKGHVD